MYSKILLILLFCTPILLHGQDRASQIREKLLSRDQSGVLVVAHRGDWRFAPENSLAAIDNAIKMGVDIVEIDVQRTKDGHIIVMHDATLNRTTTGKGKISEWPLDSICSLNLKNGCNIKTKEKIPTLEEVLLRTKGRIMLNLDKAERFFDEVYELMQKTGTTKQVIMKGTKSPDEVKMKFGNYLNEVIYMPIVDLDKAGSQENIKHFMEELNPVAFELLYRNDINPIPKGVTKTLGRNSLIWYNTLWDTLSGGHDDDMALHNWDDAYGYLIDTLNARIIQTDRPQYLIDYLKERGLHD